MSFTSSIFVQANSVRRRCAAVGLSVVVTACGGGSTGPQMEDGLGGPMGWQAFSVDQMRDQRAQQGTEFLEAMAESSFRMGLLNEPAGISMVLTTYSENVVYYVATGLATLSVEGRDFDVEAGSTFFVRGGVEHRFHSVVADLDVVVVFTRAPSAALDPEVVAFTVSDLVAARDANDITFAPLLDTSTMSLGMYMVPKGESDTSHAHGFDEFKIVVNGGGRLDVGSGGLQVEQGSLVFIEDDLQHHFRRVSDDLDVLLIWAR